MHWLQRLPMSLFLLATLPLAVAPWPLKPEVHLWEKLVLLANGGLTNSTDIFDFDLVLHGIPAILLAAKVILTLRARSQKTSMPTNV